MRPTHTPEVGNVYAAKGGHGPGKPDYWIIVSIVGQGGILGKKAVLLGIKKDMSVVSSASYNSFVFASRELLFKVDVTELRFEAQSLSWDKL